jgi:hypothetical protein
MVKSLHGFSFSRAHVSQVQSTASTSEVEPRVIRLNIQELRGTMQTPLQGMHRMLHG